MKLDPLTPREAMAMAIEEGRKGAGFVSPNPLVGAVIVDAKGFLLAKGHHARVGGDHAEVHALKQVRDPSTLTGAHVYVTLEPCAHEGRTPSCARALAALPIASVTYGIEDPNPLVAGQGAAILRKAGKYVSLFDGLTEEIEELAEIFLLNMRLKRPFVAVKVAASLDGKIALPDGSSQWITGEEARAHVHHLRGCYDAVLTGAGTVLRDNPRLNSRAEVFAAKRPRLVVLDPNGECVRRASELNVTRVRGREDLLFVVGRGANVPAGAVADLVECTLSGGDFDLTEVLGVLGERGIQSVFVEAGAKTTTSFLKSGLADRIYLFVAPKVLGAGLSWTEGLFTPSLDSALNYSTLATRNFGRDVLISARLQS